MISLFIFSDISQQIIMSPPVALTKRWKKIKKRCSFSSSDRLVRSKSFTEQDVSPGGKDEEEEKHISHGGHTSSACDTKYLTVGSRDITRFQGLRDKIAQWNYDLKKRRSSDNLSVVHISNKLDHDVHESTPPMFVVASPTNGNFVKSAVVISSNNTNSLKSPRKGGDRRWCSPSPSPPSPASDNSSDCNQRNDSYTSNHSLYQDQDSGYDGFCPEKSIYSTGSSDTSSVMSSEGQDGANITNISYNRDLEIYSTRSRPRPRPSPIYEKHQDYSGQYGTLSPRCQIAQATVVNLVNKTTHHPPPPPPDVPPPLPPRPASHHRDGDHTGDQVNLPPHPPLPRTKPKSKVIMSGAISLPRRRDQFREAARRRGSYHDAFNKENDSSQKTDLYIEAEEKVKIDNFKFIS